jgi:tetratricopeptide (TPR) repeat protein
MTSGRFAQNAYYVEYEHLLVRLHDAMARGDEPEADRLRDEMDRPERALSGAEIDRLNGLSADLYMLIDEEIYEPTEKNHGQIKEAIRKARDGEDDIALLALLRQGAAGFPPAAIAFLRAKAYERLGHLLPAIRFMRFAAETTSEDDAYSVSLVRLLHDARQPEEALKAAQGAAFAPTRTAHSRILFGVWMYQCTEFLSPKDRRIALGQTRSLLEDTLQGVDAVSLTPGDAAFGYAALGRCYEGLERRSKALDAYNRALERNPEEDVALVRRGFLQQPSDPAAAVRDFQVAVQNRTSSPLPYLFLAREALLAGLSQECLDLCGNLLRLQSTEKMRAAGWEFIAIARSLQRAPDRDVEAAFRQAMQLDPTNDRIQENFRLFQEDARKESPMRTHPLFNAADVLLPASTLHERFPLARAA